MADCSRVTFVTGTSCAGKSTLGATLEQAIDLPDLVVVDVDAHAPCRPQTAWLDWLRWRSAELLHSATEHEGADWLIVTGIVWPLSLIQSPAWKPAMRAGVEVEFVLLHPPWKLVNQRLKERVTDGPKTELKALRRYNRELRGNLRSQVEAVRLGHVLREVDVLEQVDWLLDDQRRQP